jgi:tol-pal system protein YbgF
MPASSIARFRPLALRAVALGALLALTGPARAGLLEDDEARKAILDLRAKLEQLRNEQSAATRQLAEQVQALQRSLLDLNNQNEQLRAEIARLRGQDEQILRDLSEVQRKQKDIVQGVDERMRKLEPQQVSVDGKTFMADPEEKRLYDDAMTSLRGGDFDRAAPALAGFLKRYPASGYVDAVRYWLGNAQYGQRQYKDAIATFRAFVTAAPDHPRAPEALLALANCQAELKDNKSAKKTLEELIKQYPKSEAAQVGRERLVGLK